MVGDAFEGNLIASTFNHGDPSKRRRSVREIHDFPFAAKLSCDAARPPTATLTLEDGDDVTCTLTNDDRPGARPADAHLTLVKRVINNSGGRARRPTGCCTPTGRRPSSAQRRRGGDDRRGPARPLRADGVRRPRQYKSRGWACTGGSMTGPHEVRIADGQTVVCTVTNDDLRHPTGVGPIGPS